MYVRVLENVRLRFGLSVMVVTTMMATERITTTAEIKVELLATAHASEGTSSATKHLREDVIEIHVGAAASTTLIQAFLAELVVSLALLRVRKYLVCICNFLEFFLGAFWVILVLIWVELDRHLLELLLDLSFACVSLHAEQLVIVFSLGLLLAATSSKAVTAAKALMEMLPAAPAATWSPSAHVEPKLGLNKELTACR